MKAIEIKSFGGPEGLAVVDLPAPLPAAGQVLISVEAVGVGGVDTLIRSGALASYGFTEGFVPGGEVAGTVTAVGDGVEGSWIGRRVWGSPGAGGGYAEQAVASAERVVPLPADLSAVDAVTLGSAGSVAHFALAHAHFVPGETVLVRGASGSLGLMTVQLAARGGAAAVAVTTSSAERGERLRALGATHVLDRSGNGNDHGNGSADAPAGYDVIIDIVAGADLPAFFVRLNPNGRLVAVGMVGGQPPADFGTKLMAAFRSSLTFATFSLDTVDEADLRAERSAQFAAAGRGGLEAVVHEVLPLDEAVAAHRKMDAGEVFGRIVLIP
ncbi:zinc-binding dehydrogenase [Streptomyces sp. NPDC088794]|uniref:zinc-binding dehydrogenase n=1 Tax=Streptomyces sp. NPDC088794 TaxID=3365902 RepID=UPI003819EEC3